MVTGAPKPAEDFIAFQTGSKYIIQREMTTSAPRVTVTRLSTPTPTGTPRLVSVVRAGVSRVGVSTPAPAPIPPTLNQIPVLSPSKLGQSLVVDPVNVFVGPLCLVRHQYGHVDTISGVRVGPRGFHQCH